MESETPWSDLPMLTVESFLAAMGRGDEPEGRILRGAETDSVERAADGSFVYTWTTEAVDRHETVIVTDGIDTRAFEKNPVGFYMHDPWTPIGVWKTLLREKTRLGGEFLFRPDDAIATAVRDFTAWRIEQKALKDKGGMVSIGFRVLRGRDGKLAIERPEGKPLRFLKTELYEVSHVSIGSNRDAAKRAAAAGVDFDPLMEWARGILDRGKDDEPEAATVPAEPAASAVATGEALRLVDIMDPTTGTQLFSIDPAALARALATLGALPDATPPAPAQAPAPPSPVAPTPRREPEAQQIDFDHEGKLLADRLVSEYLFSSLGTDLAG